MALSDQALDRLADIVELQPTKNAELQDRWGLESGSEVHQYLEEELGEYYFRDDDSLIRATEEAAEHVSVKPGVETRSDETLLIRVPRLERTVLEHLPGPDERGISVVATLRALEAAGIEDIDVEDVREALQTLRRKGAVEVVYRLVPTYRLETPREQLVVEAPGASA